VREDVTDPSNFRSTQGFDTWLRNNGRIGLAGIDTRALTRAVRVGGAPNGVIAYNAKGEFDIAALTTQAREWPGLEGMDLAKEVSATQSYQWDDGLWTLGDGYATHTANPEGPHVVAIDYGLKRNILRNLVAAGARVTVVPAMATFDEVMAHAPDGVFLSNGPGDPAETGKYAVPVIQQVINSGVPTFGICLGHQMLGLAVGAKTKKMHQGHHGANHPVKDETTGKVEITSMNHGFAVDEATLPKGATQTHISLFDGSNCGIQLDGKPVFSVQYHPEASPGPRDSHYLFKRFADLMRANKAS
jgi:carbamoyl-phosphate synthase small subunit